MTLDYQNKSEQKHHHDENETMHRFLMYHNKPIKCELTAQRFGNMGNEYF